MNGDEVEVALVEQRGRAPRAVVRSVLQRAVTTLLGTFSQAGPLGVVTPLDVRLGHDFFVVPEDPCAERLGLGEGDVVLARITEYPTRKSSAASCRCATSSRKCISQIFLMRASVSSS